MNPIDSAKPNNPLIPYPIKFIASATMVLLLIGLFALSGKTQLSLAAPGDVYDNAFFNQKFSTIYDINMSSPVAPAGSGITVNATGVVFGDASINYNPDVAYRITGTTTTRALIINTNPPQSDQTINLILNNVSITYSGQSPLQLAGATANVTLWLMDESNNSFVATAEYSGLAGAGINVLTGRTLTIYGSSNHDSSKIGKLIAKASSRPYVNVRGTIGQGGGAGIGGNGTTGTTGVAESCGTVNIYGGVITASGGHGNRTTYYIGYRNSWGGGGAGIGGAGGSGGASVTSTGMRGGDGGDITIANNAVVTAIGFDTAGSNMYGGGAGIGGGGGGDACMGPGNNDIGPTPLPGNGGTIRIIGEADVTALGVTGIGASSTVAGYSSTGALGTAATVYIDKTTTVRAFTIHNTNPAIQAKNNENKSADPAYMITGSFYSAWTGTNPQIRVFDLETGLTSPPTTPADAPRMIVPIPDNVFTLSYAFTAPDQDAAHDYICIADQNGGSSHIVRLNSSGAITPFNSLYSTSNQYDIGSSLSLAKRNMWLLQKTLVTFNANGGTPTPPSQSLYSGEKVTKPDPEPTKAGSVLEGWYSNSGLTTKWDFDTMSVGTTSMTLYAKWLTARKVTFVPNGGTFEDNTTVNYVKNVGNGLAVTPPVIEKDGYIFGGWYTEATLVNLFNFTTPITADRMLYAKWLDACTVTFDLDGGNPPVPPDQLIPLGEKVAEPPVPTKNGYVFAGWYQRGATDKWDFSQALTTTNTDSTVAPYKLVLAAKWKEPTVNLHVRQLVMGEKASLALPKAGYLMFENSGKTLTLAAQSSSNETLTNNYTSYKLIREDLPFTLKTILPSYYKLNHLGYKITATAADNPSSAYRTGQLDLSSAEFFSEDDIFVTVYITPNSSLISDPMGWYEKMYSWNYQTKEFGILP